MLSNTLRLNFCCLKIIHTLHAKIKGHILENKQKKKCVWIQEIMRLMIMKMKMKNRSHRYGINNLDLDVDTNMMLICVKQHLSNIWSSIHEKVEQLSWKWPLLKKKLFNGPEVLSSTSDKAKLFPEIFSGNFNLDDSGVSLPVYPSRTTLKLHNTSVTFKYMKKVLADLDLAKVCLVPDIITVVVLKNCEPESPYAS